MNKKQTKQTAALLGAALMTTSVGMAKEDVSAVTGDADTGAASDLLIKVNPLLFLRAAHGSQGLPEGEVVLGGHDPQKDGFTFQGLELGATIQIGERVSGMVVSNIFKRNGEDWDAEFEEGFLRLNVIDDVLSIRGGRMLVNFGAHNSRHSHAWQFADAPMSLVRYLGEDGFALEGGEIDWRPPTPWDDNLILAFGTPVAHAHEEEEDHGMGMGMGMGMGGHDHDEEAELARPEKDTFVARYQFNVGPDDFNRFITGFNYLTGTNGFDMTTDIYGLDFTYLWRENGYEPGGRHFIWRTEWIMRDVENDEGGFEDEGIVSEILWMFRESWEAGFRYGWLDGVEDPELAERHRYSPSLTKYFKIDQNSNAHVRLQWNHDDIKGHGTEDSFWIQFGFDWGPGNEAK